MWNGATVPSFDPDTQKDDDMSLQGKKIAILIAPRGTEDPEFAKPQ